MEFEHVERDEGRGLRKQRAGDAGVGRAHRIGAVEAAVDVDADRAGAQRIALDRAQRHAERRIDDLSRDDEEDEEHRERIEIGVFRVHEVEFDETENLAGQDALQTVRAAGEPGHAVGEFGEDERDAERHHEAREIGAAQHKEAGEIADEAADGGCDQKAEGGIAVEARAAAGFGEQARDIGAQPEEGAMAERDDAGVAEHDVEREREEREDRDFVEQRRAARKHEGEREGRDPQREFRPAPFGALTKIGHGAAFAAGRRVKGRVNHCRLTCQARGRTGPAA